MLILVINCGSSSIKFRLYRMPDEKILSEGKAEKNGEGDTNFEVFFTKKEIRFSKKGFNYETSISKILHEIVQPRNKCLNTLLEIDAVGHRLIHGGESGTECVEIDERVLQNMKANISLAPLHYPANISGIRALQKLMPDLLQTGIFDTAFHQSIPEKAFLYGLPFNYYEEDKIRRYGFHGTSHKYVSLRACELTGIPIEKSKIISCHLGNGASLAAIKNGKSIDTSMGMTPVEGLMMGSRCGDIDAGVILHLQQKYNLGVNQLQEIINKKSGLLGISGISSDLRTVIKKAAEGHKMARLAIDMFTYRIKKYIGSYFAVLGGADVLIFTGGIGQNSSEIRFNTCQELECFGIKISKKLNKEKNGKEALISSNLSNTKILIVPSNEELMIARETYYFAKLKKNK